MKRQALAFFTMFSLILMLSIYYITLPKENTTTQKSESVIKTLEDDKEENKDDTSISNDSIISDPTTSSEDKIDAISENEQIKENKKMEEECSKIVLEAGYDNTVEIKDKTIYISIAESEEESIASNIMKLIYNKVKDTYFIEVNFTQ